MSGYGLKTYNPEETKNQWVEICKREEALRNNHVVTQGGDGVSGTWKIEKQEEPDITKSLTYFKATTKHSPPSIYDRINHVVEGYNQKLHRDDREHTKSRGLKVNAEETRVKVPVLSSSIYGHPNRKPLEWNDRSHVRVELCTKDFSRVGCATIGDNPDLH